MTVYQKCIKFFNQNNLTYREVIGAYSKSLIIDSNDVYNQYYVINVSNKVNSRCVILDITFDLEGSNGELFNIQQRISYNQLIKTLGEQ